MLAVAVDTDIDAALTRATKEVGRAIDKAMPDYESWYRVRQCS
jgi:hypothetical protein